MRIMVVDDHPLARKGIISILSENGRIREVVEAASVKEAVDAMQKEKADVAIVDLKLGREDGLEVVSCGKALCPETKFIILTSFISRADFLRAEAIGADGYLLKEAMAEDILFVVHSVLRGKKYYDPGMIAYYNDNTVNDNRLNQLTGREKEVMLKLGMGLSNEEIAGRLYISSNTVKKHISSILSKLDLKHRTEVALFVSHMDM